MRQRIVWGHWNRKRGQSVVGPLRFSINRIVRESWWTNQLPTTGKMMTRLVKEKETHLEKVGCMRLEMEKYSL